MCWESIFKPNDQIIRMRDNLIALGKDSTTKARHKLT